jgi:hypothetical protein
MRSTTFAATFRSLRCNGYLFTFALFIEHREHADSILVFVTARCILVRSASIVPFIFSALTRLQVVGNAAFEVLKLLGGRHLKRSRVNQLDSPVFSN